MKALPVWNSLAAIYQFVERTPGTVLLEGSPKQSEFNEEPWTRLFTAPSRICVAHRAEELPGIFSVIEQALAAEYYAAGYFGYECGMAFEPTAAMRSPKAGSPIAWFGIYDRAYIFNAKTGEFTGGAPPGLVPVVPSDSEILEGISGTHFSLTEVDYAKKIATIHELIRAGDIYQLNFTAPFGFRSKDATATLYARLRERQPARYGAFLHAEPGQHILSFSPELFFRIDSDGAKRRISTRPMKGTSARGRTNAEDRKIAAWLRNDPKNRAENLMIVDLLRNDLGRIARFGTVQAERLFAVERLRTLWQMTSTVTAELREEVSFEQVFRALFPCGSVTGAPKVHAMQLIGELEDGPRGVYTGSIGFFSSQQTVFNVAIRTIEMESGVGTMGIGSGVVIDSDAAAEYRECMLKADFLTGVAPGANQFSLIETMLWDGKYPLLDLHLERLAESARYFDLACNVGFVRTALLHHASKFGGKEPRRVRFLLSSDGTMSITHQSIPEKPDPSSTLRVCIAAERTDATNPLLYHKTTDRALYDKALAEAHGKGFVDVLFFNTRGELTEGAISSVFLEKDGRWFTPPVECGLLPGIYRRHLLETRSDIEQRTLLASDLRTADAVYISNAVRGLRKAVIDWM